MGPNFMYDLFVAHTCAIHTLLFEPFGQLTCLLFKWFHEVIWWLINELSHTTLEIPNGIPYLGQWVLQLKCQNY